jgi:hypothetical protein
MTRADLLTFLRARPYAVVASINADAAPQAAVVGVAVLDDLSLVFDTVATTRKAANLLRWPAVAFVFGSLEAAAARTVQYEGVAERVTDAASDAIGSYLAAFPDGRARQQWPGLLYFRVRPRWIRYSDFGTDPVTLVELTAGEIDTFR